MSEQDAEGLAGRGGRQQLTFNDPAPLSYPPNCFEGDLDVFKLSPDVPIISVNLERGQMLAGMGQSRAAVGQRLV